MESKQLTIFEGVDGSGKTTIAKQYAEATNALYVHFPALPLVENIARLCVEAMMPALMGYQEVVFDRSWYSEPIYGAVHRAGVDRIGLITTNMLERLSMRCGAVVVNCDPGWNEVEQSYKARKASEMLENVTKVKKVHDLYFKLVPGLPNFLFNYTQHDLYNVTKFVAGHRMRRHDLAYQSAGNLDAPILLVGDEFAERKNVDPWYQWPFGSFSGQDCSAWLTDQLATAGIPEDKLLWINKKDIEILDYISERTIICLGQKAETAMPTDVIYHTFDHPQAWMRFHGHEPYPLISFLKEKLK